MIVLNKKNWQVPCFYICALLFYPLAWSRLFTGRLAYWGELNLFTPGLIALLCCSLLLFNSKTLFSFFSCRAAKLIAAAFAFILLISFIQVIVSYNGQVSYLWTSVYWIAIPLFCAVNRREIEKYLPFFIIFLGLAAAIQSFQNIRFDIPLSGIPGNQNWNASLLALACPFICFGVYRYFGKYHKTSIFVIATLVIIAAFLLFRSESKAAVLALIIASASLAVLRYWRKLSWVYWLRAGIFLAILGFVLLSVFKEHIFVILKDDQRLFLWTAALDLIRGNLWFGCGPELFESTCAPYIPADYYFGKLVSTNHPHAHNHLLQFAATMGIPALIVWCSVLFYAMIKNLRQAVGQGNWELKLYLFTFILLFIHSMFDVVVLSWPLGCIFLIIFGILLGRACEGLPRKEFNKAKVVPFICAVFGICLTVILFNYLYFNLLSSTHYRNARLMLDKKNVKAAFAEAKISIAAKPTAQNTYLAARISFYDREKPQECLKYLDMLDSLGIKNYVHNNLLRAKALDKTGKSFDSLLYFAQEQEVFPASCVNLYYFRYVLSKLERKQHADAVSQHLKYLLEKKGFTESILPAMQKNPDIDFRFRTFNANKEK